MSARPKAVGAQTRRKAASLKTRLATSAETQLEIAGAQPRPDTTALGARRRRFRARHDDAEIKSVVKDLNYNSFPLRLITNSKPR